MKVKRCPQCHNRLFEVKGQIICRKCRIGFMNKVVSAPQETKEPEQNQEEQKCKENVVTAEQK